MQQQRGQEKEPGARSQEPGARSSQEELEAADKGCDQQGGI
jgi:hypothetical protein